jgi:hypothetical protein
MISCFDVLLGPHVLWFRWYGIERSLHITCGEENFSIEKQIKMGGEKASRLIYSNVVIPFSISSSWSMKGIPSRACELNGKGNEIVGKRARVL